MTKTLLLATVIVAIAGPAIAGCDDAAPRLRAHCWQLQFERSHDGMRKFAMRGLTRESELREFLCPTCARLRRFIPWLRPPGRPLS
jgi:hypothetical protein